MEHLPLKNRRPLFGTGRILRFSALLAAALLASCAGLQQDPADQRKANALYMLGTSYLAQNRLQDAYLEFQRAIVLDPDSKEAYNMLGLVHSRLGQYDEAIASYEAAIAIEPRFSEAYNNMSLTYNTMERWDDAIAAGRRALENPLYENPEFAYNNIGRALLMKGDCRTAIEAFRQAILRRPIPQARYNMALAFTCVGREDNAIQELERLVKQAPKYADAQFELARLLEARGNVAKARDHYAAVITIAPHTELAVRAEERLKKLK